MLRLSPHRFRYSVAALFLTLFPTTFLSAQTADRTFSGRADVTVIEIPVQVSKDGQPLRGLTKDDFEVLEGRNRLPIIDFEVADLDQKTADGRPARVPVSARRHFVFLFDLAFSEPTAVVKAREAAHDLVRTALHPSDLAAVATFTLTKGPRLLVGFTPDRAQIAQAIESLGADTFDRSFDPLNLTIASLADLGSTITGSGQVGSERVSNDSGPGGGGGGGAEGRAALIEYVRELSNYTAAQVDLKQEALRVDAMSKTMADLAKLLGTVDGRKHLVYFSEGFSSKILVGDEQTAPDFEALSALERGETQNINSNQRFGDSRTQNAVEEMLEEFRRANTAIHTIDIGGLRAGADIRPKGDGKQGLVNMAKSTGGEFYDNFNQLDVAVGQMLGRTSVTYLLVVQPNELKADGKYHRIKVRLKDGPRGARVDHRPGFYGPQPLGQESPAGRQLTIAEMILSGEEGGGLVSSALVTPFRVQGQPGYVPVLVEVDGRSLLAGHQGDTLPAEIFAYALGEDGRFRDFFNQNLTLDLTKVRTAIQGQGLKFFGHLDLPPGDYSVRILVRNAATEQYALQVVPIRVAAMDENAPVILPPLFPEPMGKWMLIREGEAQQKERSVPFPFVAGEQPFLPAASPRIAAGTPTDLYLMGYNLKGELGLDLVVLDGEGNRVNGATFAVTGRGTALGDGDQLMARFDPKDLPAGRYSLHLTVTDRATGLSQTATSPFEVIGGSP
jgi:VWFA-related protein